MMPSDKDILGKADALLRRHTVTGSETGAFPVLTDLIDDPAKAEATQELASEVVAEVMAEVEARLAVKIGDLREELAAAIRDAVAAALERRNVK